MARPASLALAGFYPAPLTLIDDLATRLVPGPDEALLDPCAGQGEAVLALRANLRARQPERPSTYVNRSSLSLYAVELEAERHAALQAALPGYEDRQHALHGDAFRVQVPEGFVSVLYLNPPYDTDPQHGRLEARWLQRFLPALAEGGVLVFLVPFYALGACAAQLAQHTNEVSVWRFPDEHPDPFARFDAFKQVFLVARRCASLPGPDARLRAQIEAWGQAGAALPTLADAPPVLWTSTPRYLARDLTWRVLPLDLTGLAARVQPWQQHDRRGALLPTPNTTPPDTLRALVERTFPVAMPLRPSHLGAALASGVFHGARLQPDDPASGLPEVLVKGVFRRPWLTQGDRTNKDGKKVAEVQVQAPEMRVTVLDLAAKRYHDLSAGSYPTGARDLAQMNAADLLTAYSGSLRAVVETHCPALHDPRRPGDDFPLRPLARPLFRAQADAVRGCLRLLGGPSVSLRHRRNRAALLLGEVGTGKTACALAVAHEAGARRPLVLCPPHLLDGWREQIAAVLPGTPVAVLRDADDVARWAASAEPGMHLGLLSREAAKLGHRREGVARCPRCGHQPDTSADEHAKRRATCGTTRSTPADALTRWALDLATLLGPVEPTSARLDALVSAPLVHRWRQRLAAQPPEERDAQRVALWRARQDRLVAALDALVSLLAHAPSVALLWAVRRLACALVVRRPVAVAAVATRLWTLGCRKDGSCRTETRTAALALLWALPASDRADLLTAWRALGSGDDLDVWARAADRLAAGAPAHGSSNYDWAAGQWAAQHRTGDENACRDVGLGQPAWALAALDALGPLLVWESTPCGEPLFQATPDPRRVPLSDMLVRRYRGLVDFLILDEVHELATAGAAQEQAAHRLMNLGTPTLLLTGSLMNGYADSLFTHLWAMDRRFRAEFERTAQSRFVDRYGYKKRLVETKDKEGKTVEWGTVSDRVEQKVRVLGDAPGVSPLCVVQHLLRLSVVLHKSDLAIDLPPCREERVMIEPSAALDGAYEHLRTKLLDTIKKHRFDALGACLWGQVADLPSYLDRATVDVGNGTGEATYELRWPASAGALAGSVIASVPLLPAETLLPKEAWMLATIERELAAGRPCLVFGWHTNVLPRLVRLLEKHLGEKVALLRADKVEAAKRQDWINKEVIGKKRRVLVVNPKAVETGLNNLVTFATQVWMQSPACNPLTYRQAVGRVHRLGQKQTTRILFPVYRDTSQDTLHTLLLQKVAVSLAVDGLDAESALDAAGAGDNDVGLRGLELGQALYRAMTRAA